MNTRTLSRLLILLLLLTGCSSGPAVAPGRYLAGEDALSPYLVLDDDNTFVLSGSPLLSYAPHGTWAVQENRLILTAGDEEYSFSISGDGLIFESGPWLEQWAEAGTQFQLETPEP